MIITMTKNRFSVVYYRKHGIFSIIRWFFETGIYYLSLNYVITIQND
jgi:hypothetical protein